MDTMWNSLRSKDLTNRFLSKNQVFQIIKSNIILRLFTDNMRHMNFKGIQNRNASIWIQCAIYRVLRTSPVDSSRKIRWGFLLKSPKTTKYCDNGAESISRYDTCLSTLYPYRRVSILYSFEIHVTPINTFEMWHNNRCYMKIS